MAEGDMYGLIGRITAAPGRRSDLVAVLLEGTRDMPGCLSYIIAEDPQDDDSIWVTEAWKSQAHHQASLSLPTVQEAIAKARPMVAGMGDRRETVPVGGHGLSS